MAVQSGVLGQMEAQGMGAVGEEQGLCALELAASMSSVVGMAPVRWPVLLATMSKVPTFLRGFEGRAQLHPAHPPQASPQAMQALRP